MSDKRKRQAVTASSSSSTSGDADGKAAVPAKAETGGPSKPVKKAKKDGDEAKAPASPSQGNRAPQKFSRGE